MIVILEKGLIPLSLIIKIMQKYTKQQVLDEKISFKPMKEEQYKKLKAHFGYGEDYRVYCYYRFYPIFKDLCGKSSSSYLGHGNSYNSTKEIFFEEFDFEEVVDSKTVLPSSFYVLSSDIVNGNKDLIKYLKLLGINTRHYEGNIKDSEVYRITDYTISYIIDKVIRKYSYPSYTLEELKQLVNNKTLVNNTNNEQKTVIAADSRREKHCISRPSSSPRQIELGKRFVGNPISAKTCSTRTVSVKIQPNIISFWHS